MNEYQNYQTAYIAPKTIDTTVQIGMGLPKIKSHIKIGNLIFHNTHQFNWFHRKMWKLFFGFEIENIKEKTNEQL